MNNGPLLPATEIIAKLQELTTGLYYQSESDYPLEVVLYTPTLPDTLPEKELVSLTGHVPEMPVEVADAASFFRKVTKPENITPEENNAAKQIATLQTFCEQHLPDLKVYRIGSRTQTALLLGKLWGGKMLGLKTTVIQT